MLASLTNSERHPREAALADGVVVVDVDVRGVVVRRAAPLDEVGLNDAALVVRQRLGVVAGELQLLRVLIRYEGRLVRCQLVGQV